MINNYDVAKESKNFAFMIIDLYKHLIDQKEFIISKQILRSGTSIGANISESKYGYSRKDFLHKITLSLKESAETEYWLDLLEYGGYLETYNTGNQIKEKIIEILKVLTKIVKTTKENGTK